MIANMKKTAEFAAFVSAGIAAIAALSIINFG